MVKWLFSKFSICLAIVIFWTVVFVVGSITVVFKGPSIAARDLLVTTVMETSAAKFVARLYFTEQEIEEILGKNTVVQTNAITDSEAVSLPEENAESFQLDAVEIEEITGATYKGKMLIVNDPSRLYVATPEVFDAEKGGLRVEEMVKRDNACAGVNGGGFKDENGVGSGGEPLGIVIQSGVLTFGSLSDFCMVIGFDNNNKLIVGSMTAEEALRRGVRDAVSFQSPALIVNGEPSKISGTGGGLNPRTAIGQRADGAVLLLAIDGRQSHSLGASLKDLVEIMQQYGAINAANLDGGSSTLMVYNDEIVNVCASLYGSRKLPTAILVRQVQK